MGLLLIKVGNWQGVHSVSECSLRSSTSVLSNFGVHGTHCDPVLPRGKGSSSTARDGEMILSLG